MGSGRGLLPGSGVISKVYKLSNYEVKGNVLTGLHT